MDTLWIYDQYIDIKRFLLFKSAAKKYIIHILRSVFNFVEHSAVVKLTKDCAAGARSLLSVFEIFNFEPCLCVWCNNKHLWLAEVIADWFWPLRCWWIGGNGPCSAPYTPRAPLFVHLTIKKRPWAHIHRVFFIYRLFHTLNSRSTAVWTWMFEL